MEVRSIHNQESRDDEDLLGISDRYSIPASGDINRLFLSRGSYWTFQTLKNEGSQ